ncbi:hypothetical protein [Sphingomonas sp. 1P08PE]|uniref:hypothetical protein n=1 Tax=Sphingomonas sp. 1P08PE TaxID=554122 RepID=UPI0039A3B94C
MTTSRQTREAAAIAAALMVARLARLRFDRQPDGPTLPLGNYLLADDARLLLVPSVGESNTDADAVRAAMHQLGHDALMVRAGGRRPQDIRFQVGLSQPTTFWSAPLRLWIGGDAPAHFIADEREDTAFALLRAGLRGCEVAPWSSEADRAAGLLLGNCLLADVLGSA